MNSGPNQPPGNGGGRGRRRRRGRRGHGGSQQAPAQPQGQANQPASQQGQGQPQPQQSRPQFSGQQNRSQRPGGGPPRGQQNRRPGGKPPRRQQRGPVNRSTPDAGIYSAPMDHSYRLNMVDGNSNGNGYRYNDEPLAPPTHKPIYCFVDDLFFLAKIQET